MRVYRFIFILLLALLFTVDVSAAQHKYMGRVWEIVLYDQKNDPWHYAPADTFTWRLPGGKPMLRTWTMIKNSPENEVYIYNTDIMIDTMEYCHLWYTLIDTATGAVNQYKIPDNSCQPAPPVGSNLYNLFQRIANTTMSR